MKKQIKKKILLKGNNGSKDAVVVFEIDHVNHVINFQHEAGGGIYIPSLINMLFSDRDALSEIKYSLANRCSVGYWKGKYCSNIFLSNSRILHVSCCNKLTGCTSIQSSELVEVCEYLDKFIGSIGCEAAYEQGSERGYAYKYIPF